MTMKQRASPRTFVSVGVKKAFLSYLTDSPAYGDVICVRSDIPVCALYYPPCVHCNTPVCTHHPIRSS